MDKHSRPAGYDMAHRPIDAATSAALLADTVTRRIAATTVAEWDVSTVFLVIDHDRGSPRGPVLYETLVFDTHTGEVIEDYTERYYTAVAALAGHDQVVAELRYLLSLAAP